MCLTSWYPPHHFGGYELSCFDVMTRLEERGHHVEVLCSEQRLPGVEDPDTEHEDRVHRRLQLYWQGHDLWAPPLRQRLAIERANQEALADALASCRPDVVTIWQVGAMSLGLISGVIDSGVPLVYAVCDVWPAYATKLDAWLRLFARRPAVGRLVERVVGVPSTAPALDGSGAFLFNSDLVRRQCRAGSPWQFPLSAVVYSGIEGRVFSGTRHDPASPWRGRLLFVGRLDPRKGLGTLLRALPLLPDATLAVHGPGSDAELARWRGEATSLGVADRVTFATTDRSDLPAVYAEADACVFPSEWDEPFGLVPVESMACAAPVVATGAGGSAEFLVDGENCLLYPAGDPAALADAVKRLAGDRDLRAHLAEHGLATAEFFDVEHLADDFEAWHGWMASGGVGDPPKERRPS
ncbi:MAG: glycosyltransferase family 4 protein [Acidimicrobiales bacterium]